MGMNKIANMFSRIVKSSEIYQYCYYTPLSIKSQENKHLSPIFLNTHYMLRFQGTVRTSPFTRFTRFTTLTVAPLPYSDFVIPLSNFMNNHTKVIRVNSSMTE